MDDWKLKTTSWLDYKDPVKRSYIFCVLLVPPTTVSNLKDYESDKDGVSQLEKLLQQEHSLKLRQ